MTTNAEKKHNINSNRKSKSVTVKEKERETYSLVVSNKTNDGIKMNSYLTELSNKGIKIGSYLKKLVEKDMKDSNTLESCESDSTSKIKELEETVDALKKQLTNITNNDLILSAIKNIGLQLENQSFKIDMLCNNGTSINTSSLNLLNNEQSIDTTPTITDEDEIKRLEALRKSKNTAPSFDGKSGNNDDEDDFDEDDFDLD